jgi:hypothetical protein
MKKVFLSVEQVIASMVAVWFSAVVVAEMTGCFVLCVAHMLVQHTIQLPQKANSLTGKKHVINHTLLSHTDLNLLAVGSWKG